MSDRQSQEGAPGPPYNGRTMQEDFDKLREAWLDFAYAVLKSIGIVALVRRLGWHLKPWVREREARRG